MDAVTAGQAGRAGLSRSGLLRAAREGRYDRIARGIYRDATAPEANWDWLEAATRRPEATICLTSALAIHELIDDIPTALDIAIPRGTRIPSSEAALSWHTFAADTFNLGRTSIPINGTEQTIGLYSAERSIADAFRLRGEIGYETGIDALREWLRRGGKPAALATMALQLPRAKRPLLDALAVLA